MKGGFPTIIPLFIAFLLALVPLGTTAMAVSEDMETLGLYFDKKDLEVSATRVPQLLSQSAENITVVTAGEIETMGAHTLADILANIPGINSGDRGSVGTYSALTIQGSGTTHVLVMIDGVMQNVLFSSDPDISSIPVQLIERIEIVKGPGSSSWGSSLGGVVNIVTKSPRDDRNAGGTLSASIGEATTRDIRGELSGTIDRFGYYLYAGHLAGNGLSGHTRVELNSLYSKFRLDLPKQGSLALTVGCATDRRQDGEVVSYDYAMNNQHRYLFSTMALYYPLNESLDLDLSLRGLLNRFESSGTSIANPVDVWDRYSLDENSYGGSGKITWRQGIQSLAVGFDYDHADVEDWTDPPAYSENPVRVGSDKWGVFLNDVIYLKGARLTVTPGVRYDRMNPVGDFTSPSLGLAWNPSDKITLRVYGGHGFSLPLVVPGYSQEKVWTVQTGFETTLIPYLWLKNTYFLNYVSNVDGYKKYRKQGVEVEGKTVPVFDTSLSFGYTFIDSKRRDTGETVEDSPRHLLKLGVHYDDRRGLRGALRGRYVDWNASPGNNGRYSAVIWDLNLTKRFHLHRETDMELFFNVHNLFNGSQYDWEELTNTRRWFEGGLKFEF